jgi:mRNA interferase MazF
MTPPLAPDRGHLLYLDFDPQVGHEQAGRRPGLVLSPASYNGLVGMMLACPITGQAKGYVWEVALPAGLPVDGVVPSDQVRSVDWRGRRASYIALAPEAVVQGVLAKVRAPLDFTDDGRR